MDLARRESKTLGQEGEGGVKEVIRRNERDRMG